MLGGTNSRNKQRQTVSGYTIVEVLIVLAVSGMMFVIAVNFINGKQGKAAFMQGTNEMASQIQGTIEQVSNGQYSDIPLDCTATGGSVTVTGGNTPQGRNPQCIFIGKIMRFHSGGSPTYEVLSLAGKRSVKDAGGNIVTPTLSNVGPVVVTDLTRRQNIPQQLTVRNLRVTNATTNTTSTVAHNFGFVEGLGSVEAGSFQSGAQTISMIYSTADMTAESTPNTTINSTNLAYAKSAVLCLTDGTRYAQIRVGGTADNASKLSVRVRTVNSEITCRLG